MEARTVTSTTPSATKRRVGRRAFSAAGTLIAVALVVAWALLLRPTFLGGPTSYVLVAGKSMEPTMHTGDLALLRHSRRYARGQVIAYHVPPGEPGAGALVIHRIIGGSPSAGYRTQGDNRDRPDLWRPRPADIDGRMWLHLPDAGRFFALARTPLIMATLAALLTILMIGRPSRDGRPGRQRADRGTPLPMPAIDRAFLREPIERGRLGPSEGGLANAPTRTLIEGDAGLGGDRPSRAWTGEVRR
jgi:signal peptidase I